MKGPLVLYPLLMTRFLQKGEMGFPFIGAQCGSTETYMIGTIESLDSDADGYYDNNITCFWSIIRLEVDNNVTYQFYITRMDIELTDGCYADYIEVIITITRLCNVLRFLTAVKMVIFR